MNNRTKVQVVASSYHVFGSGSGHAELVVDGCRIPATEDLGDNGFVGYTAALVPVSRLLGAKSVRWVKGSYPGGESRYEGTGRGFLRRACRDMGRGDPLRVPLESRPAPAGLQRRRYVAAWAKARATEAAQGWQFRRQGLDLASRSLDVVSLRDGARGRRWGPWTRVPYRYGYPPRDLYPQIG